MENVPKATGRTRSTRRSAGSTPEGSGSNRGQRRQVDLQLTATACTAAARRAAASRALWAHRAMPRPPTLHPQHISKPAPAQACAESSYDSQPAANCHAIIMNESAALRSPCDARLHSLGAHKRLEAVRFFGQEGLPSAALLACRGAASRGASGARRWASEQPWCRAASMCKRKACRVPTSRPHCPATLAQTRMHACTRVAPSPSRLIPCSPSCAACLSRSSAARCSAAATAPHAAAASCT